MRLYASINEFKPLEVCIYHVPLSAIKLFIDKEKDSKDLEINVKLVKVSKKGSSVCDYLEQTNRHQVSIKKTVLFDENEEWTSLNKIETVRRNHVILKLYSVHSNFEDIEKIGLNGLETAKNFEEQAKMISKLSIKYNGG